MPILLNDETIDILQFPIECVVDGKETILNIPDYEAGRHLYSKKDFFTFWSNKGTGARGFVCQNIYARNLWNGVRFDKMYFEDCAIQNKLLVKAKHIYLSGYGAYKYVQRGGSILHSESIIEKSLGDFKATIPFIGNMVKYGVERELVVKCYIITLNRLIDKSYLFQDVDVFLSDYNYINSLGIKLSEVVFYCNGLLMSRIKIFLSRCIGLRNVVRLQGLKAKFKSR